MQAKAQELEEQERIKREQESARAHFGHYRNAPLQYAIEVLKVNWWLKQQEIVEALLKPPRRVLVKACHNVGKTHLGGGLVNWFYDSFNPSICLTTAPTDRQVKDLLWKEVRSQRKGRGGFVGPKIPRLESYEYHFAHGFTARDGNSFQGHHAEHILILFDEAVGVAPIFWETAESMFSEGHFWLAIFNPTDTASQAYQEELSNRWTTISLSVLDHPNVLAESAGLRPPYPAAIRLSRVKELIEAWCRLLETGEPKKATDVEFPLGSGQFWRPGPIAESRLFGRWPSQGTYNVWSDGAFSVAELLLLPEEDLPVEIGCDVARFGDDFTTIHVRRGSVSLHHESANGWSTTHTAGRLKQVADQWGHHAGMEGTRVLVKVDDDGVGGGVVDQAGDYNFYPIRAGSNAYEYNSYPNRRSEMWFGTAERADNEQLSLARLSAETRQDLRRQAMAPTWSLNAQGQRVVEPKEKTKKRLQRSPDDMDGLNLAYAPVMTALMDLV